MVGATAVIQQVQCSGRVSPWLAALLKRRSPKLVLSQSWPTDLPGLRLVAAVSSGERAMIEFKGSHFERDVILWAVRWYVAYGSVQRLEGIRTGPI